MQYFIGFLIVYSIVSSMTATSFVIIAIIIIIVVILGYIIEKQQSKKPYSKKKYGEFHSLKSRKKTDLKNTNIELTSTDRATEKNIVIKKLNKETISAKRLSSEMKKYQNALQESNKSIEKSQSEITEKNIIIEKLNNEISSSKISQSEIKKYEEVLYKANNLIEELQSEVAEKDLIIKKLNKKKNHTSAPKKIILNDNLNQSKRQQKDNGIIVERESFEDF